MIEIDFSRVEVSAEARRAITVAVAPLGTLAELIRLGLGQDPPREVELVVEQDEYSLDVVLPWGGSVYLVFDTT